MYSLQPVPIILYLGFMHMHAVESQILCIVQITELRL